MGRVKPVDVLGVRVEMPTNQPIVLLRERNGERYLPIWIGAAEATAIAYAQQGVEPPRPLTHDLLKEVIETIGPPVTQVRIVELRDKVFYAILVIDGTTEISARPSDAIALALRTETEIVVRRGGPRRGRRRADARRRTTRSRSSASSSTRCRPRTSRTRTWTRRGPGDEGTPRET